MAQHIVNDPSGTQHIINAPDDATPEQVMTYARQILPNDGVPSLMNAARQTAPETPAPAPAWSDIPGQAFNNLGSSATRTAQNIVQPILHPIDTLNSFKNIGAGAVSKAAGALGFQQDPEQKAETEAPINAVGQFIGDRYGSVDALKKTLATDPVGALADASLLLTGGGSTLARAPGVLGKAGEAVSTAGNLANPIAIAGNVAKGVGYVGGKGASLVLGTTTGAGPRYIQEGYNAGKAGSEAFPAHMRGQAPATDIVDMADTSVRSIIKDRSDAYKQDMGAIRDAQANQSVANPSASQLINFQPINDIAAKASDMAMFKGIPKSQEAADVSAKINDTIAAFQGIPSSSYRTVDGLDALKQAIGEIRQKTQQGTLERNIADQVYNGVKDQIVKQVPDYADVMRNYGDVSDKISEIKKTFSLGEKASTDTALRKLTSVMRNNVNTNYGQRTSLMEDLAQKQPDLPYAIAGQAANSWTPRGLASVPAGMAALSHNPLSMAMLPFASPRIVGEGAYAAGQAASGINALANYVPHGPGFRNALAGLYGTGALSTASNGIFGTQTHGPSNR